MPTSGWALRTTSELAGIGPSDLLRFFRCEAETVAVAPLARGVALALSLRGGVLLPWGASGGRRPATHIWCVRRRRCARCCTLGLNSTCLHRPLQRPLLSGWPRLAARVLHQGGGPVGRAAPGRQQPRERGWRPHAHARRAGRRPLVLHLGCRDLRGAKSRPSQAAPNGGLIAFASSSHSCRTPRCVVSACLGRFSSTPAPCCRSRGRGRRAASPTSVSRCARLQERYVHTLRASVLSSAAPLTLRLAGHRVTDAHRAA